jgi:hypothetical protein
MAHGSEAPNPWGREGRRAKRQQGRDFTKLYQEHPELFKKPSRYKTELLFALVSMLVPFGWGEIMSSDHALWRIWVGWTLWAVPVLLLLHIVYRYLTDREMHYPWRIICVSVGALVFIATATINIHLSARPSFPYMIPGLLYNDNATRIYYVLTKGRYPFFAVDLRLTDVDRLKDSVAAAVGSTSMFHWDEVDQRSNGWPVSIAIKPWRVGHETFTASFQTRDVDVVETMRTETRGFALFPYYYVKIVNQRTGRLIMECKSHGFPTNDSDTAKSGDCEPLGMSLNAPPEDKSWRSFLKRLW